MIPQSMNITIFDYGNLAFSIANAFWNENVNTTVENFPLIVDIFKERYAEANDLIKKKALGFILSIPGNPTNQIIIFDNKKSDYNNFYRRNLMLTQIVPLDFSITRDPNVTMEVLGKTCEHFSETMMTIFNKDDHLTYTQMVLLTHFTTFAMVYYKYRLPKADFIELLTHCKHCLPKITEDNKIYENLVSLIFSRNSSEEMIFRCMEDGINGVEPNNLFKSRIVPGV